MRASAIRIDLPVSEPVPLSGAGAGATAQEIDGTLEANALWLEQDGLEPVLLVSVDALSVGRTIRQSILGKTSELADARLGVFASHSHSTPALDPQLPALGAVDTDHLHRTVAAVTAGTEALAKGVKRPVTLLANQSDFPETVYRRRKVLRLPKLRPVVTMMPDDRVEIDRSLRVAVLRDAENAPIAILWTIACHPTCYPDKTRISADYPGIVRARLRKELGVKDLPVLFLQGCTGDIRPALYDQRKNWKRRVKSAIYGKTFGPITNPAWQSWSDRMADLAIQTARKAAPSEDAPMAARREEIPLTEINSVAQSGRSLFVQSFEIGGLRITGLSAEPSNAYADEKTWRVGYLDHIFGYLPTEAQWHEGGYEARAFRQNFSLEGDFRAGFESLVREQLAQIEAEKVDTP